MVGADGSRTSPGSSSPRAVRTDFFRQYPFAWFGILAEAPPSSDELIYAHSERGFALSASAPERAAAVLPVRPRRRVDDWSDDRIWAELDARVGADGQVKTGPIFKKDVLQFRSFVCEPMQHGNLFLAGDAAHTVPPTGAKGLNLADGRRAGARPGARRRYYQTKDDGLLAPTPQTALGRVWRAQWFSFWMTTMLHRFSDASDFDLRRQVGELEPW